jgi:ATP/maltotriose-dependent transcriptional regulator MalT
VSEGRAWLDELLSLDGVAPPTSARLLVGAAALATYDHDLVVAGPLVDAAITAARESADDLALAWALLLRELSWLGLSKAVPAEQILTACAEGIDRSRGAGDAALESAHMNVRAVVLATDGRFTEGEATARFAMRVAAEQGVSREVAFARLVVAVARYASGDLEDADELFAEARQAWRTEGEHSCELMAVSGRALIAADRGNTTGPRTHLTLQFDLSAGYGQHPRQAERILQTYA